MTAITLPADTVWLDDGRLGVAIVEGDRHFEEPPITDENQSVLFAGFVAPKAWVQYDKPCENIECGDLRVGPCSLCGNAKGPRGRQVWTVRWPCEVCEVRLRHWPDADREFGNQHADCNALGYLSARATVQVVPVVAMGTDHDRSPAHVCMAADGVATICDGPFHKLDPLPTPGRDFAVLFHIITEDKTGVS